MSPTSLHRFEGNTSEYYLYYLSDNRPEREPQTRAMAAGSGFDAFLKNHMFEMIYGRGIDARYTLDALLETQLESHNRDWGRTAGARIFDFYIKSGALADLMLELGRASTPPRFEFDVTSVINGVPILGKPDISFTSSQAMRITLDTKVNGYVSRASPLKGYVNVRPANRNGSTMHPDVMLGLEGGIHYNMVPFEDIKADWADQLCTYAILIGSEIGSTDWMMGIEQIAWGTTPRVASHRGKVGPIYQKGLFDRYKRAWDIINSDWIFRDLSLEGSQARCAVLDMYKGMPDDFKAVSR